MKVHVHHRGKTTSTKIFNWHVCLGVQGCEKHQLIAVIKSSREGKKRARSSREIVSSVCGKWKIKSQYTQVQVCGSGCVFPAGNGRLWRRHASDAPVICTRKVIAEEWWWRNYKWMSVNNSAGSSVFVGGLKGSLIEWMDRVIDSLANRYCALWWKSQLCS